MMCSKCKVEKPATSEYFAKDKRRISGLSSQCRDCVRLANREYASKNNNREEMKAYKKQWYLEHREEQIKKNIEYRKANKEAYNKKNKIYNEKNREKINAKSAKWYREHPEYRRAKNALYNDRTLTAMPEDIELQRQIKEIYYTCPAGLTIDHMIPIKHDLVCGLHVPYNLTYLTKSENSSKCNKFTPYIEVYENGIKISKEFIYD